MEIFPLFAAAENLAREVLFKPYPLQDVKRTRDEDLRQQRLSGLVAFAFKNRKTKDFEQFLKELMPWVHQIEVHHGCGAFLGKMVLKYIIDRNPEGNKDLLVQEAKHYLSEELCGDIMTIAQQWEQEGIQKGIQQGMQQGEAAVLKRQLQRRFGEIPFTYLQRIHNADAKTLLCWSENILDAKLLEDVFG